MEQYDWLWNGLIFTNWTLHYVQVILLWWRTSSMGWENDVHANMTTLFAKQVLWSPSFLDKPLDKKKLSSKNCNLRFILVYFIVFPTLSMTPPMASNDLQWNALGGNCWVRGSTCSPWVSVKGPLLVSLRRHQERRGEECSEGEALVGRRRALQGGR